MVEINNNGRSSICWRGRRELITWRQKTRNHGYDVIVGGELFTDYSDHPRKLVTLNPNSNQQAPDATSFFLLVGCHRKRSLALKDFSLKSQDAVALQIKERGALPMIDRGDIRQAIDRCRNIWASSRRWLWSVRA